MYSPEAQRAHGQMTVIFMGKYNLTKQSSDTSLFGLVQRTRSRLASDSRDKIYGVVALTSDTHPLPFPPTYDITVDHLFEEFAAHVIRLNESLEIFKCCSYLPGRTNCPSWVPDWRHDEGLTVGINPEREPFRAAGASCWDASTAIQNHVLGVDAICLDRLQNVTSPDPLPFCIQSRNLEDLLPI